MSEEKPLQGIDRERVGQWLAAALPQAAPPFAFRLIAAGGSNLTYRLEDARGSAFILRRPPVAGALATAHDMSREWRIMRALRHARAGCAGARDAGVLRRCRGDRRALLCDGVRRRADPARSRQRGGHGRRGMPHGDAFAGGDAGRLPHARSRGGRLGDLGRHEGYVARQLARWRRQVEASKTRELPLLVELHERLGAAIPPETRRPGSRTATIASTTPCSRRTTGCARCSTGSSAPSAIRWRTSSGR